MDSSKLAQLCRDYADNKKGENIVVLDVRKVSTVTDYFVICTGTSEPHVRAIVREIGDQLREEHNERAHMPEGAERAEWVVLDYFDVIVHVMRADVRALYDLEGLWGDAAPVKTKAPRKKAAPKLKKS
ncbi:MAG: ribosome silencing factor [Pedosphaera sp.]|nr:ribosome silencing factor [Pedosphaera sp.]MST01068.1 ribosome silencing factor [Pedosphaera sp.]